MALTYTDYVTQIATMAVLNDYNLADPTDPFTIIVPQMINYAELRIQRDLDLFAGQTVNTGYTATAGSATVTLQEVDFITIQSISVSGTSPNTPLLPTTKEYLQYVYPVGTTQDVPKYFSMYSTNAVSTPSGGSTSTGIPTFSILLGPIPDQNYALTINGTLHTQPMSATNTVTWISTYLPDLFIMASMIYVSAYQRNFGKIADDPAMAQTYEAQYNNLLKGAMTEEFRKKFQASAWSSIMPSPVATPTR